MQFKDENTLIRDSQYFARSGTKCCPGQGKITPFSKKLISVCDQENICYVCYVTYVNCALVGKIDALSGINILLIWGDTSLFNFLDEITLPSGKIRPPRQKFTLLGTHLHPVRGEIAPFFGKNTPF